MTGYILKVLNIYPITTLNSHLWVYFKCAQFFTTGHIVIILGQSFKMGVICNQQAHFGHSGRKHSECAQFLTITHIVDPLWRTFKIYPIFTHWVHCGQVLSVPTMYSPCAHWVYGSLSPVTSGPGSCVSRFCSLRCKCQPTLCSTEKSPQEGLSSLQRSCRTMSL